MQTILYALGLVFVAVLFYQAGKLIGAAQEKLNRGAH